MSCCFRVRDIACVGGVGALHEQGYSATCMLQTLLGAHRVLLNLVSHLYRDPLASHYRYVFAFNFHLPALENAHVYLSI